MEEAGFQKSSIVFVHTEKDLNVYQNEEGAAACCAEETETKRCCDKGTSNVGCCFENNKAKPCCTENVGSGRKLDFNHWVASYQIYAIK